MIPKPAIKYLRSIEGEPADVGCSRHLHAPAGLFVEGLDGDRRRDFQRPQ